MDRRQFTLAAGLPLAGVAPFFIGNAALAAVAMKLDSSGLTDCTEAINQLLADEAVVFLPPGSYLIGKGSVNLRSGSRLLADGAARLIKKTPVDVPLLRLQSVNDVRVSGLRLENHWYESRLVDLTASDRGFPLELPLPWRYPSLVVEREINGEFIAMQYSRDFHVSKAGPPHQVVLNDRFKGPGRFRYYTVKAVAPLIAIENSTKVTVQQISAVDGAIAYFGTQALQADLLVANCVLQRGQIRAEGAVNRAPPLIDHRTNAVQSDGPRGIVIQGNRIDGELDQSRKRYLKFTERVHGIVLSGNVADVRVVENEVVGTAGDGIQLQCLTGGIISGNKFLRNGLSGIGLENTWVNRSQKLEVSDNVSSENWFDGCDFNYGDPLFLTTQDLSRKNLGIDASIALKRNVFRGNGLDMPELSGGCGIYVRYVKNAQFEENICTDNNVSGILLELSSDLTVVGNVLSANGRTGKLGPVSHSGLAVVGCTDVRASKNRLLDSSPRGRSLSVAPWRGKSADGMLEIADSAGVTIAGASR